MSFELSFHPIILPFLAAFFISLALTVYGFRIRNNQTARLFAWYAAAMTVWQFTSVLELASVSAQAKLFWTSVKYIGSATAPVLGLLLALSATRRGQWLRQRWLTIPLWTWGIATILVVLTNEWHHWYWISTSLRPEGHDLDTEKNWWFGVYAAGMYITIFASTVMYLTYVRRASPIYRKQAYWFAIGGFLPLGFRVISDFAGVEIIRGADQVVFLMLFTLIAYAVALFRYSAFRLMPVAYDQIVHDMGSPVLVYDLNQHVLDANPAALELFSLSLESDVGRKLNEISQVSDWSELDGQEWWYQHGAEHRCFQVQLNPLHDGNQTHGYSLLLTEITQLKNAEARLAAANQQKQQMTADLAHDLRTPIQIVSGYLEALGDGMMAPSSERYQSMQHQMTNLSKLVTDIMVLAKSDAGDLQLDLSDVQLADLARAALSDFEAPAQDKSITLDLQATSALPSVKGDPSRIEQVLHNLLRNALTFTPEGGRITLSLQAVANDAIECVVEDSGIGLAPEHLNLVFDRAFRVSKARATEDASNGLGLAICKSLIEAQQGSIGVTSDGPGHGCRFWFRLPVTDQSAS